MDEVSSRTPRLEELERRVEERTAELVAANRALRREVAERARVEEALRESELRFRTVVETLGEALLITDLRDVILYANPRVEEIFGYAPAELVGRIGYELLAPRDEWAGMVSRMKKRGEGRADRYEMPYVRRDGRSGWIEVFAAPFRDAAGEVVGSLGAITDITERKRVDEALRESRERYRLLFDGANDAVFVYGIEPDGTPGPFREVNAVACERLGYTREELLRLRPTDLHPPEMAHAKGEVVGRLVREGSVLVEWEHLARDGRRIPVEVNAHIMEMGGQPTVISIARDVTERKRAEEALRESQAQLQHAQKMEAVGRLAGGVAHDFNNMLTAIQGFAQLLAMDIPEPDPARMYVEEIRRAADRSAALTRQLLAFSRRQILQPEVLDLNGTVREMERMLRRVIEADIDLVIRLDPELGRVRADPGQVEQVLLNLAVNARDAMPHGGRVVVETHNATVGEEEVRRHPFLRPGEYVALHFRDTGTGMDPEVREKVFDPFYTTKEEGTGLGLATVYGIVKQSGGYVWVESEPGEGASFRILLPRVAEAARPAAPAARKEVTEGEGTVLLVEDEPAVRLLVRKILQRSGYRVLEAGSGAEAIRLFRNCPGEIDLLLTDVVMPSMGGAELVEYLTPLAPGLRVLYMSGYAEDAIAHRGILDPGTEFVAKPFTPETLTRRVHEVLSG